MNILILGAGQVGTTVAYSLAREEANDDVGMGFGVSAGNAIDAAGVVGQHLAMVAEGFHPSVQGSLVPWRIEDGGVGLALLHGLESRRVGQMP